MPTVNLNHVRTALNLPNFDWPAAHARMAPIVRVPLPQNKGVPPRQAGVLVLVYPLDEGLHIILTRRTEKLRGHSGQISFPGGSFDPQDGSLTVTALRETCEELGICDDQIQIIGMLSTVYIPPTHFDVFPSVAALPIPPTFDPNPEEVAEVFTLSLDALLDERLKHEETRTIQGYSVRVPYYLVHGHKVWGATAVMLSELEYRLRAAVGA